MATFTVTTGADVVDANDGLTSLREALALAESRAGADTIVFSAGVRTVRLGSGPLTVNSGEVTVDGDRNNDGLGDVTIDARYQSNHLSVQAGASVTIDGLTFANGYSAGSNGAAGANGANGVVDEGPNQGAADGFAGEVGVAGGMAAGSIVNRGDLTLVHAVITNSSATGGAGGAGGGGGAGSEGRAVFGPATGGDGGAGGVGGDGGGATGGVLNLAGATLQLIDTGFVGVNASGGVAGAGGAGGSGGVGSYSSSYPAGNGGDGGNAGAPGRGGDAAAAVLNYGTVLGAAGVGLPSFGTVGIGAGQSAGGPGGAGGEGVTHLPGGGTTPDYGDPGSAGAASPAGASGTGSTTIVNVGVSGAAVVAAPLLYLSAISLVHQEGDSGSTAYTFQINRSGSTEAVSVSYAVTGSDVTGADFVGGALPTGTVSFAEGQRSVVVTLQVAGDRTFENDEYFFVGLSNPTGGAGLGTSSIEGVILADDAIAKVYADATRTTLVDQLFTADDLAEAAPYLAAGQVVDIAPGATVARDVVIGAEGVTVSGIGATTAKLVLGDGVGALTLGGDAALSAAGNALANTITGNAGANVIDGLAGADTMRGGAGGDTYYVDDLGDRVIEALNGGTDTVMSSVNFSLAGQQIENLQLIGSSSSSATGNSLKNILTGNSGANRIDGMEGADTMQGGLGDDVYVVDNIGDRITEAANGGYDSVEASLSFSLSGLQLERLTLTGTDAISGSGNSLANTIVGNSAANFIDGGGGADRLRGNGGADTFVFSSGLSSANVDQIVDFKHVDDVIALDDAAFAGLSPGMSFTADMLRMAGGASIATTANQRIVYDTSSGSLFYDRDGSGTTYTAIKFATLMGAPTIDHTDFMVI